MAKAVRMIRNPLACMSKPESEEALELARKYEITAAELIEAVYERGKKA